MRSANRRAWRRRASERAALRSVTQNCLRIPGRLRVMPRKGANPRVASRRRRHSNTRLAGFPPRNDHQSNAFPTDLELGRAIRNASRKNSGPRETSCRNRRTPHETGYAKLNGKFQFSQENSLREREPGEDHRGSQTSGSPARLSVTTSTSSSHPCAS